MPSAVVHSPVVEANFVGVAAARLAGVPMVIASMRNLRVWKRQCWYRTWRTRIADTLGSRAADVVTVDAAALVDRFNRGEDGIWREVWTLFVLEGWATEVLDAA